MWSFLRPNMKPQLHYIHADAQIGNTYYLWGFNILCLLLRGDAAILIVCGEISYGKHKKLSHPFLGVGFSAIANQLQDFIPFLNLIDKASCGLF